jgi:hypothetical protein
MAVGATTIAILASGLYVYKNRFHHDVKWGGCEIALWMRSHLVVNAGVVTNASAIIPDGVTGVRAWFVPHPIVTDSTGKAIASLRNLNSIRFADQFSAGSTTGGINEAIADFGPAPACGTVILPFGVTNITSTVGGPTVIGGHHGCNLIGHGASNNAAGHKGSYLVWTGPAGGTMFNVAGCTDCYSAHFSLDGMGTAGIGFSQTVGGGSTSQQNQAEDIFFYNITGTPGYSLYVGGSDVQEVSESTYEKMFINRPKIGVYQEGAGTLNIHYKDFSISAPTVACFDIEAGSYSGYGNTCVSIQSGGTASWIIKNISGTVEMFNEYDEHSTNVPSLYFPGVSGHGGPKVIIEGGAYACSYPGCEIVNYTQNGSLSLTGSNFGGNKNVFNFSPLGPANNYNIGVLTSVGGVWGDTTFNFGTPYYSLSLHDNNYGGTGTNPDPNVALVYGNSANHISVFENTDIQLIRGEVNATTVEALDRSVLGSESLTDGSFSVEPGAGNWTVTGGWDATFAGNAANYSATAGTLTQAQAKLAVAGVGSHWYEFTYGVTLPAGTIGANIENSFVGGKINLPLTAGTQTVYFKSKATPTDLVISATGTGSFTIDALSLREVQGGDVIANGNLVAGSHIITEGGPPSVTGTGCSLAFGTDSAGQVTLSRPTSCRVTFRHSFKQGVCTLTPSAVTMLPIIPTGPVTTALAFAVSSGTGAVNYSCTDVINPRGCAHCSRSGDATGAGRDDR